jgi:Domain of unknown function (DUF6473)
LGGLFYQAEANHIVDYELWRLEGSDEFFRGPQMVLQPNNYVAYVGAAQSFGTLCRFPFPNIVTERIGAAAANLGIGGAGPDRFLRDAALLRVTNNSRVAVIQVMSGRSMGNSLYETLEGTSSLRRRGVNGPWTWAEGVWKELLETMPSDDVMALMEETRGNWVEQMSALLRQIERPKILLWISRRRPHYEPSTESLDHLLGAFPHFVNAAMLDAIKPLAEEFVDATSGRGSPQHLYDRFTGEPTAINRPDHGRVTMNGGYPSPEMHVDIAEALAPVLKRMWHSAA